MQTDAGSYDRRQALRMALGVGLAYLGVGTLWILFSDSLVESISRHPDWLVTAQRFKGLVYIGLTTLGLIALVQRGAARLLQSEQRRVQSDLRAQDLFERHPQPMWVYDRDSLRILRVNDAAVAAYGFSRAQFLDMSLPDLAAPSLQGQADPAEAALQRAANAAMGVHRHRRHDGRSRLVRLREHAVQLRGRSACMAMAEDVTDEAVLKEALLRQQRQFQQLHQSLAEVLWLASPDMRTGYYVSPAFERLYGRPIDALIERPALWRDVVHPDDVHRVPDLQQLPPGCDSLLGEYRIIRPDGTVRWVEDRKRLMRNTEGAAVLVGGIAEDITARKERDEARDALHHRLESLVAERTAALQDANLELEAFTRTAAHDLKTPLNAIVGLCGLLRGAAAQPLTDAQQRHLMLIERSSRDMATLINDLLALSRAGHVEVRREVVDLAPMVREQIETLRLEQPLRHCEWIVPPHLPVHGDAGLLRSALHNLIGNAWKFTGLRERARIECAIEHEGSDTTLVVRDNGAGFDASGLDERLRPFQRFHTQAQFQGHGLGLVTCQRIAHRHGGRLVIDSVPGQGTVVRLTLPSALAAPPDVPPQETLTPARDCAASPA